MNRGGGNLPVLVRLAELGKVDGGLRPVQGAACTEARFAMILEQILRVCEHNGIGESGREKFSAAGIRLPVLFSSVFAFFGDFSSLSARPLLPARTSRFPAARCNGTLRLR